MPTALEPAGAADVLYLVDLSGYVFRAYHAIRPLTSPSGEPTHAVFGTVSMLERLVRERRPALLAVAMDAGRETFRNELYPAYKANRPPAPEDLIQQMARVEEVIDAFAIPILKQAGVEADDLIASAVKRARERGLGVVIVSADKDLMQLVGSRVVMWDTMRDRVFGVPEVEERFGVHVDQVRDYLALVGDASDNVPGVPSVGPKTAAELLGSYRTLEGVYANLDAIKRKKLRDALEEHREQARLSQTLVTLKDDCEITLDGEALRYGGRDLARLRRIYAELGFHRLIAELDREDAPSEGASATPNPAGASVEVRYECVVTRDALAGVAAAVRAAGRAAIDTETTSLEVARARLVGLSLAWTPGHAVYVPVAHRYLGAPAQLELAVVRELLGPVLADASVKKTGHNLKYDESVLIRHGLPLAGVVFDSRLADYLIDPERRHGLKELAERELGVVMTSYDQVTRKTRGHQLAFEEVPLEEATPYAAADADLSLRLMERLSPRLEEAGLTRVLDELELPLSSVLAEMERVGVLVDTERLRAQGERVDRELTLLEQQAHQLAGREFNVNSPRQLETLLFDELRLQPLKRTKTSRSTDAETLEALSSEHALPGVILELRQLAKLKGTYIDALPRLVNPETGRIHTSWEQAVAATGRLSSTDPNLQNIPIRTALGRAIRAAFVAPPGTELVSADYSQIELRVLAHLSRDPVLLDSFQKGEDIHARTAMEIFELPPSELTPEHRRRAKAVNFGVIYGQGDSGLAKSLGISRAEASSFIAAYFRRYEGVRRFMDDTLAEARLAESVRTLFGRRRLVPDLKSGNRALRLAAERIAMNTPIQGTAADLLKLAMLKLAHPATPGARMVLTVHDELVFEVPTGEVPRAIEEIRAAMEGVAPFNVPLVVDIGHGADWSLAH
ncbi:MAG: DNA polymerase I [Sorangiineae bacterium]|nr:DNA polymerase I [Polyangiaceae bacterium]MEB2324594.1 DNA polymerase I [Sorangiineae bacterium]